MKKIKQFFAKFGWITVSVLVICTAMVLTTPLGEPVWTFIDDKIESVTEYLFGDNNTSGNKENTNQYGFYFDKEYVSRSADLYSVAVFTDEVITITEKVEEGSGKVKFETGGIYKPGEDDTLIPFATADNEKDELIIDEQVYVLEDTPTSSKNAHGFYFNTVYSTSFIGDYGETVRKECIFFIDGSYRINTVTSMDKTVFNYSNLSVNTNYINKEIGHFSSDGVRYVNEKGVFILSE